MQILFIKKNIDKTLQRIDRLRSQIIRAKDKGGIILVANNNNGIQITTYRMEN
jgi:hypothetical protein